MLSIRAETGRITTIDWNIVDSPMMSRELPQLQGRYHPVQVECLSPLVRHGIGNYSVHGADAIVGLNTNAEGSKTEL